MSETGGPDGGAPEPEAGDKSPPVERPDSSESSAVAAEVAVVEQGLLSADAVREVADGLATELSARLNILTAEKFIEIESTRSGRLELEGAVALIDVKITLRHK